MKRLPASTRKTSTQCERTSPTSWWRSFNAPIPATSSTTPLNNLKIAIARRVVELWRFVDPMVLGSLLLYVGFRFLRDGLLSRSVAALLGVVFGHELAFFGLAVE